MKREGRGREQWAVAETGFSACASGGILEDVPRAAHLWTIVMTGAGLESSEGDDWIGIREGALPVDAAWTWASRPGCGGIVTFCGTVRDHSVGRSDVTSLEYETYEEHVVPRLADVATAARERWPEIGRLVLLHRVGRLEVGEVAVVVTVSTPHRAEAFSAAQFCIDTLKHTVPIWKRETWAGGSDWSLCAHDAPEAMTDGSWP